MEITFQPKGQSVEIRSDETLLETAQRQGVPIVATCGGKGRCKSCRIHILDGHFTAPTAQEIAFLGETDLRRDFRLACQVYALSDGSVRVVPLRKEETFQILAAGERQAVALAPNVQKIHLHLPVLAEEAQTSDFEEIQARVPHLQAIELTTLQTLPEVIERAEREITAVACESHLIAVESGDTSQALYGLAFDIGTTTVVGYLLDLLTGKELAVASALNGQARYGGDVMARITLAQQQETGLDQLHEAILATLNHLIEELCSQAGVGRQHLYETTIVGNPCMHHLFLKISPMHLGLSPYLAAIRKRIVLTAAVAGLKMLPQARVVVLPLIAGFVGADTVGVILATGLHNSDTLKLAVDIGTNGEIVLGARDRLVACSTAAGPAFEGSHITHGMRGALGAIDKVRIDTDVHCHVIGDGPARGICGSGLVDAVAQMLAAGVLTSTGRFLRWAEAEQHPTLSPELRTRLIGENQQRAFILVPSAETETGDPIVLTQQDIRELQLAKGAIRAGIATLMQTLGVTTEDITELLLAGAFGNYLDPRSAVRIGLLPALSLEKIRSVGNAAGLGAQLALLSTAARQEADAIALHTEHVALTNNLEFQRIFAESMGFPEQETIA
jgi:uncharacterized 2Fe-2S/4Fe-4S cluster protein (DUF4445 family)